MPSLKNLPKLIIIRGPSGSGKSSVAKALKEQSKLSVVVISQDQFRDMFNDQGPKSAEPSRLMVEYGVLTGLEGGFNVVLEGVLNVGRHEAMFDRIFKSHPNNNYIFFFDVSFKETLKRHSKRPESEHFGEKEMKEWWSYNSLMKHAFETIIPESSTLEETITAIRKIAGI